MSEEQQRQIDDLERRIENSETEEPLQIWDTVSNGINYSGGKVGINRSNVQYTLDVVNEGSDYAPGAVFRDNGSSANWARIDLKNSNVSSNFILYLDQVGGAGIRNLNNSYLSIFTNNIEHARFDASGDLGLGSVFLPTANGGKVFYLGDNGATNPTMGTNTAGLFAKDVAGTVELFAIDEAGNATQLSSHNFELFTPDDSQEYPFSFSASNPFIGKKINVDMFKMARLVEGLTGEKLIYLEDLPAKERLKWSDQEAIKEAAYNEDALAQAIELHEAIIVSKTEALQEVFIYEDTNEIDKEEIEGYELDQQGNVKERKKKTYKRRKTNKKKMELKEGFKFDPSNGGFYRNATEADVTFIPYTKKARPSWMPRKRRE